MKSLFFLLLIFLSQITIAQTDRERQEIKSNYDKVKSDLVYTYMLKQDSLRKQRLAAYKKATGLELPNARDVYEDGTVVFDVNHNFRAARTIRSNHLNSSGSLGLELNGQDMVAGVWEAENGYPRLSHNDLTGRITVIDGTDNTNFHATHVVGTIISSGQSSAAFLGRGIAYEANVLAANSDSDITEMTDEARDGLLVSNHSYGYGAANLSEWFFGAYNRDAFDLDLITNNFEYYLPVISAGNDRDDFPDYNPDGAGYDLLTGFSNSKNAIVSAAVVEVLNYERPGDVQMSVFSNWGPTDDGRIKPDISSNGVNVLSTSDGSDTAYSNASGTSMSAPSISGLLLLLQQHYNNLNGEFMKAATAKGLLLHSADEAGNFDGPDYSFGWGLANGKRAAEIISDNEINPSILETQIDDGEEDNYVIVADGDEPLMISISWYDPQGSPVNGDLNDTTPLLVNDLDILAENADTEFYPWKLNNAARSSRATRNSTNDVDNFEKIQIDEPLAGEAYTVRVNHKNALAGGSENYSLIVSGGYLSTLSVEEISLQGIKLYPNPTKDLVYVKGLQSDFDYKLYDAFGRQLSQGNLGIQDNQVDLNSLNSGIYLLQIYNNNSSMTKKIIKN